MPEEELMTPGHGHIILADLDKIIIFSWHESFAERNQICRALLGPFLRIESDFLLMVSCKSMKKLEF